MAYGWLGILYGKLWLIVSPPFYERVLQRCYQEHSTVTDDYPRLHMNDNVLIKTAMKIDDVKTSNNSGLPQFHRRLGKYRVQYLLLLSHLLSNMLLTSRSYIVLDSS